MYVYRNAFAHRASTLRVVSLGRMAMPGTDAQKHLRQRRSLVFGLVLNIVQMVLRVLPSSAWPCLALKRTTTFDNVEK